MDVILRGFKDGDGAALMPLHRRAIMAVPDDIVSPEHRRDWAHGLEEAGYVRAIEAGEHFIIAERGGVVVGFCSYLLGAPEAEIVGLYVDPDAQRRGVARALVTEAERRLFDRGATAITARASPAGEPAWTAMGYRITGQESYRSRGGSTLAVARMAKPLSAASQRPHRNFYGRRKGQHLKDSQERYLAEDLEALSPGAVDWDANPQRTPLDLDAVFGTRDVWLEVGFGGGEHLIHQAASNPDVGIIGCEPYINGVAMLLGKIREAGVQNLRVHPGDARDLFDVLPEASIAKAFLLYPDPWPKKRHHRRRFVTPEHLDPLARVLKSGAEFRVATDIPDYVRQTLEEVPRAGFDWLAEGPADWREAWPDWYSTRYEQKALREGRVPHYVTFRRR